MSKKVTIKNLIDICNQLYNQEISLDEFKKACDEFSVRNSLSIREKITNVMYVLFNCDYSDDLLERFISLEMNKFWYIVLAYCNIDASLEVEYCTEENYDLLYSLLFNAIMSFIKNDYDDTMRVFDSIINYVNALENQNLLNGLLNTDFSQLIESDKQLIEDLMKNEDIIGNLADIVRFNNSDINNINTNISKQVVNTINNK